MIGKYDPMDPITSTLYAHDARKVIKEILARGKIPIVEGGSPFYIS
jgi:tRNA A37 N6-isopentenylltransferase MiaA